MADTDSCCCNGRLSVWKGRCYSVESVTVWLTLTATVVTVGCPCGRVGIASVFLERTAAWRSYCCTARSSIGAGR